MQQVNVSAAPRHSPRTVGATWIANLAPALSLMASAFGATALLGYGLEMTWLYRPQAGEPAMHPFTALLTISAAMCVLAWHRKAARWHQRATCLVAFTLSLFLCVDHLVGSEWRHQLSPFAHQVASERALGWSNDTGFNTAVTFWLLALANLLICQRKVLLAQLAAFFAVFLPSCSLVGHLYGIKTFYGEMSIFTTVVTLLLSWSVLLRYPLKGGARILLSPGMAGRVARLQWLVAMAFPILLGFVFVESSNEAYIEAFALYVVSVVWSTCLVVSLAAMYHDSVDRRHRESEHRLAVAASRDPLTGLYNRGKFFHVLIAELRRFNRTDHPPWLLMIDADHFKRINDTVGHVVGDRVLRSIATVLKEHVREVDVVARIGGEEFCVMLMDTNRAGAELVAENLRRAMEMTDIDDWTEAFGPVTISIGLAEANRKDNAESLIARADAALYQAKERGRNQIAFSERGGRPGLRLASRVPNP